MFGKQQKQTYRLQKILPVCVEFLRVKSTAFLASKIVYIIALHRRRVSYGDQPRPVSCQQINFRSTLSIGSLPSSEKYETFVSSSNSNHGVHIDFLHQLHRPIILLLLIFVDLQLGLFPTSNSLPALFILLVISITVLQTVVHQNDSFKMFNILAGVFANVSADLVYYFAD